jgi:hypothetical protein
MMNASVTSSLLWGAVGGMAFLALAQGYHLFGGEFLGIAPMVVGAIAVLVVTAGVAYALRPRLVRNESP